MNKYCGKCGSVLDEKTGKCPKCELPLLSKKEIRILEKEFRNNNKSIFRKIFLFFRNLLLVFIVLSFVIAIVVGILQYKRIIDIPFVERIMESLNLRNKDNTEESEEAALVDNNNNNSEDNNNSDTQEEVVFDENHPYYVTLTSADDYYHNNAQVVSEFLFKEAERVNDVQQCSVIFADRGFAAYPITTNYSIDGEYTGKNKEVSNSLDKYPVYQTYYIDSKECIWIIEELNGNIVAYPYSFALSGEIKENVFVSEKDTITAYSAESKKYYECIPNASIGKVYKVERIDAQTLDSIQSGDLQ